MIALALVSAQRMQNVDALFDAPAPIVIGITIHGRMN
jgi:hypothetical protein